MQAGVESKIFFGDPLGWGQFATMGADKAFGRNLEKRLVLPSESWLNFFARRIITFRLSDLAGISRLERLR